MYMYFMYRDSNAYVDSKHILLNIKYKCMNEDGSGLKQEQFISCINPAAQGLIDSVNLNIG